DMNSRYTDQYPDVVKLKTQIARAERLRAEILSAPKKHVDDSSSASHETEPVVTNSALAQLQGQLKVTQNEIANHEHRIEELQRSIGEYQGRLNSAPATEQQLTELTRGYEASKADYDELQKKKNASEMATNMEQLKQGERFTVLDPPSLPTAPSFPNHLKFCGMGLG